MEKHYVMVVITLNMIILMYSVNNFKSKAVSLTVSTVN